MKIAVEGCCHGELNKIYEAIQLAEQKKGLKVDLLICCGDFQAVRNVADLSSMAVPEKYRQLMCFHEYYSGKRVAPVPTLFIGGNHEASNHLWELGFGGWVAPNIYYLGLAGVVQFGGLRIAGLSGIYNHHNYHKNHFETPPYTPSTLRSAYHVRSCDHFRLKQLSGEVDIGLSHDWPQGIEHHGNTQGLLKRKPYFRQDISTGSLGSPPAMNLLQALRPHYWFSAHLHVKFPALYEHNKVQSSPDRSQNSTRQFTKFLALDKCLPKRSYLQVIDIPVEMQKPYKLTYDPEWLAILRSTEQLMNYSSEGTWSRPSESFTPSTEDVLHIEHTLFRGDLTIPDNFEQTLPAPGESPRPSPAGDGGNPQTERLCRTLGIANPFKHTGKSGSQSGVGSNPDEISLDDEDVSMDTTNPDESLDDSGWCIDTIGSNRTPLALPPPSTQLESHDQSYDSIPESHDTQDTSNSSHEQSHDQPKIKRRNLSLYTTPAEDIGNS